VDGDERLRLFLGLRLPDDVVRTLVAWAASELAGAGGRLVPSEHVHVTLAFLGSRPSSELPAIVGELREAASAAAPIELEPARWRATRSVGMVVLHDHGGAAGRLADDLHGRLEALGVYPAKPGRGCRTSPSFASASGCGRVRSSRRSDGSLRPMPLLSYPVCTAPGPGTRCSSRLR